MQTKSSNHGKFSVVKSPEALKGLTTGEGSTLISETQKSSILDDPYDTWIRAQAHSYLGRSVTLDEARELWSKVDINTRKPLPSGNPQTGPLSRLLRALRAVSGEKQDG